MKEIQVKDSDLRRAAEQGMDEFVEVFYDAISDAVGGQLAADSMARLHLPQPLCQGHKGLGTERPLKDDIRSEETVLEIQGRHHARMYRRGVYADV